MKKFYYHPGVNYDSRSYSEYQCFVCGRKVNENALSEDPCLVVTAAQSVYDGEFKFEIMTWNCKATLLCFKEKSNGKREHYAISIKDDSLKEKINKLTEQSVYDAGGAVNISGIYPLNEELERTLEVALNNGEIVLEPKAIFRCYKMTSSR